MGSCRYVLSLGGEKYRQDPSDYRRSRWEGETLTTNPSSSVERLVDLLGDADPDVRLRSALELGEGRHGEAAVALVARFGRERDFAVRETLTWAVLRIPDAALPLVRDALRSSRWLARLQATHTLSKVGPLEDGERLVPLVGDPVDAVAARAYWAVGQCGDPATIPALVAELSRGSSEQRNSLTVALSRFGAVAVPALVGALRHGSTPEVRSHAADTLAYLGSPGADLAEAALGDAVRDGDEAVRIAALNALGQLVSPSVWDLIDRLTTSTDPRLRLLARRLMERRPTDRALREARRRAHRTEGADDGLDLAAPPPPAARTWPTPDLSLVSLEGGPAADELAPKLALQVELCRPQYLSRADVPASVLDAVRADALVEARGRGRPDELASRIAAGAVEQFIHEHVLLEQVSVVDPGVLVKDLLFGTEVHVAGFVRLEPIAGGS